MLSQQRHRLAMQETAIPIDFLVQLTKNFVIDDNEEFSSFQELHREACLQLQMRRPNYRKRKLKSNALVIAMFMMIEKEVDESEDDVVKRLFVDVYKDRSSFINDFIKELDKTDEVERDMSSRRHHRPNRGLSIAEESVTRAELDNTELDTNTSLLKLIDFFENKDLIETTKVFKVFTKNGQGEEHWTVGVAHAKIKKDPLLSNLSIRVQGSLDTQQFTK